MMMELWMRKWIVNCEITGNGRMEWRTMSCGVSDMN